LVKEVASLGGDVSGLIPDEIRPKLLEKLRGGEAKPEKQGKEM